MKIKLRDYLNMLKISSINNKFWLFSTVVIIVFKGRIASDNPVTLYNDFSKTVSRVLMVVFNLLFHFFALSYLLMYVIWRFLVQRDTLVYLFCLFFLNLGSYLSKLFFFAVTRCYLFVCYFFLFTGLIIVVERLVATWLYLYKYKYIARISRFVCSLAGFIWFRVILSFTIRVLAFIVKLIRVSGNLLLNSVEFIFWYYMFCLYLFIRVFLFTINNFLVSGWLLIFHSLIFIHSIKLFYYSIIEFYTYMNQISLINVFKSNVQHIYMNIGLFLPKFRFSPLKSLRFIRGLNTYDVLVLITAGFRRLGAFLERCVGVVIKLLHLVKRVLLFTLFPLWPFLLVLRIVYGIIYPFLSPFIDIGISLWHFLDRKTLPLRNLIHYRSMFPRRSPIEELNHEEFQDIAVNADFLNQNVNTVLHPIFSDVIGDNLREFMFDSMDPGELFRNDYELLETDQFSFVYVVANNDYASQVHAEFYGVLNMLSLEDILKEPNIAGFDYFEGSSFSRETFTILGYLESLMRSFSSVKEIGKEDFKEESVAYVHLPDESADEVDVPAGNVLKKRISWFLSYYKYISKRFDLFMNGQMSAKDSKEFFRKEKIFSKEYLRRHSFRRRLVFNSNKVGYLHLTPTFLSKVEELLKKDLSEYFMIYGDPQFEVESRYSNRMLYHGILNLAVVFFIVVYVFIPDEEHALFYNAVIVTVVFITTWLFLLIYFSIFKRRTGLISRKGLTLDGSFRLVSELIGGWAFIMFFLCFVYHYEVFLVGWDAIDINFLLDAFCNEKFYFDWLINIMSEDDDFIFDECFKPMFSMIERAQMLNNGVWNGQFYNPAYILYAQDLRYIKETFISYAISHYVYLWHNVPSPIIAIIGDTCMLLKFRFSGSRFFIISDLVNNLPSSFVLQNYLLDLKYKVFYSKMLELDIWVFNFLKVNLNETTFEHVCALVESIAFYLSHLRLYLMSFLGLDMQYASISILEISNIKMAQFAPQIKRLEEETLTKSAETITQGRFLQDICVCLDVEIPETFRDMKNFELGKLVLTFVWFILNFFFFDMYTLLGLPLDKPVGFILPEYFGEEIEDVLAGMYQKPSDFAVRDYLQECDEDSNPDYDFLISSHDLLDDYRSHDDDVHLKGHAFVNEIRFALSPVLTKKNTFSSASELGVWLSASSFSRFSVLNRLWKDYMSIFEYLTPWTKVVHHFKNRTDRRLLMYTEQFWFANKTIEELVELNRTAAKVDVVGLAISPWYVANQVMWTEFLLQTSFFGNFARFELNYMGPDTIVFSMLRGWPTNNYRPYEIFIPKVATLFADLYTGRLSYNYLVFWNWGHEPVFYYGSTMEHLSLYSEIQNLERLLKDPHTNNGGQFANTLFFYYNALARCAYNESFFSSHYKYPLFYNLPEVPTNNRDKLLLDYIRTNLLLCDKFNTQSHIAMAYDRKFRHNYEDLSEGACGVYDDVFEDHNYRKVEVPQLEVGDVGVVNRAANLSELYFDNLLNDRGSVISEDNIYLRLVSGDEYVFEGDNPFIYSKFYDGFLYYLIEREGKNYVVPVDVWLRDEGSFNDTFVPHYDIAEKDTTMLSLSERYFKQLADWKFERKHRSDLMNVSIRCPTVMVNLAELVDEGSIKDPEQVLANGTALRGTEVVVDEKNLTWSEWFDKKQAASVKYLESLYYGEDSSPLTANFSQFMRYRKSYQFKVPNRIDVAEKWIFMYPIALHTKNMGLIAEEFDIVRSWWEECNEYLWEIREEIEDYGEDDFCKKYHAGYLAYIRMYSMYLLNTQYLIDNDMNLYDEWIESVKEGRAFLKDIYGIEQPVEITSPHLIECKQDLSNILKSERVNVPINRYDICFYNYFSKVFRTLLNQSEEVKLCEYFGIYDLPEYSSTLCSFFDLSS
jgi:hypothetical protein